MKTDFTESHHRFDQCGVVMYLDSENWLKGSIEYENDEFQHLGSVATNHGYSFSPNEDLSYVGRCRKNQIWNLCLQSGKFIF